LGEYVDPDLDDLGPMLPRTNLFSKQAQLDGDTQHTHGGVQPSVFLVIPPLLGISYTEFSENGALQIPMDCRHFAI